MKNALRKCYAMLLLGAALSGCGGLDGTKGATVVLENPAKIYVQVALTEAGVVKYLLQYDYKTKVYDNKPVNVEPGTYVILARGLCMFSGGWENDKWNLASGLTLKAHHHYKLTVIDSGKCAKVGVSWEEL